MKGIKFLFIFISLSLFFFVKNSAPYLQEPFDIQSGKEYKISKIEYASLYILITINGNEDVNYVLSAYYDEQRLKRVQLGQSKVGKLELLLSMDDFDQTVYIFLECYDYKKCKGNISFNYVDSIELKNGVPINYYISQNDTEIEFIIDTNNFDYYNVWIRGQYQLNSTFFQLEDSAFIIRGNDKYGNYYLIKNGLGNVTFQVIANEGDYINVGYIGYNYDSELKKGTSCNGILVNGPIWTGFLKKDILEEVCFGIENFEQNVAVIANGFILTKFARAYISNGDKSEIKYKESFGIGSFSLINNFPEAGQKVCVSFPNSNDIKLNNYNELIFTIQLLSSNNLDLISEPQLNGIPYLRTVPVNSKSIIFPQNNGVFEKMSYNLIGLDGYLKMYILECDNYPMCTYNKSSLSNEIQPININGFRNYNIEKKNNGYNESPICKKQNMFIVVCEGNEEKFCEFKSLIYKNYDNITISEDKFFNQYALQGQANNYKIDLSYESNIIQIDIDIITYIGEIEVNTDYFKDNTIDYKQKIEINKILIQVEFNKTSKDILLFSVKGLTNTYYTILVSITRDDEEESRKIIETGMTYLLTIDPEKDTTKLIKYTNDQKDLNNPFMINFFSLNCEIEVKENSSDIQRYENFYYQIISPQEQKYKLNTFDYQINIKSGDISGSNICKIYSCGAKSSEEFDDNSRDILVQDNIPQEVIFNKNSKHYSFGYVHVNYKNDLLIKFKLKHNAKYKVELYSQKSISLKRETIVEDDLLYFNSSLWEQECENDEICYLQLDITLELTKDNDADTILEFTAKSKDSNFVSYIPKNYIKKDYIQNDISQNYYTELGINEEGFVNVNFLRGSGKALAKIVSINETENGANWRGKYKLPTEDDAIEIDPFSKRLNFNISTTNNKCIDGCFLLITIVSDVKDNYNGIRNYPYILTVYSHLHDKSSQPIISPLSTYIKGSIGTNNISEFHSFWLLSDADKVIIDLQSSIGGLLIFLGENKEYNVSEQIEYLIPKGNDYIYEFDKKDILDNFYKNNNERRNSIKDLVLNVAIFSDLFNSSYYSPFSFSVSLQSKELEIITVNSDQKVLCNPKKYQGINRCFYIIEHHFLNYHSDDLFIFANVADKSSSFNIYAKMIPSDYYELNLHGEIHKYIPSKENHDYPFEGQNADYLFINNWNNKSDYILVSVEVGEKSENNFVELITHIPLSQTHIIPNIENHQLISIERDKSISLNTNDKFDQIINILCIGGSGEISWKFNEKSKYYLKGKDDRLQIQAGKKNDVLTIKGTGELDKNYGMIIILFYNLKAFETQLDSLSLESSIRYIYNEIDFPISYYSKINELNNDLNEYYEFFFTLDKLENADAEDSNYYEYDPYEIAAFIVNQHFIIDKIINPETENYDQFESTLGYYDQSMRTGIIRISQDLISRSNETNPYLYLKIDQNKKISPKSFQEINIETTILKSNSLTLISESSNQFGYLEKDEEQRTFILKNYKSKKYLILGFSCENDDLLATFKVNDKVKGEFLYGKTFYALETIKEGDSIILEISRKKSNPERNITFFVFRYTFENNINYKNYNIGNPKLIVYKQKASQDGIFNYNIELTPIDNWKNYNLSYIVRIIEEKIPEKSYVSLNINHKRAKEYENPQPNKNKLIFEIPNVEINNEEYVQVIVQIKDNENIEYLSYDLQNVWSKVNDEEDDDDDDDNTTLIAVIVCTGGVILILVILFIFWFLFNKKSKDLMNQVNTISFKEDKDSALLSNEKNVLE